MLKFITYKKIIPERVTKIYEMMSR